MFLLLTSRKEYDKVLIGTVDTDVAVLAMTSAQRWGILGCIWSRENFRFLPIHELADTRGPQKGITLLFTNEK